jgi:HPt (histidine-containing phosphotransfer) domain-containing protein
MTEIGDGITPDGSDSAGGPRGPGTRLDPAALERLSEWGGDELRTRIIGLFLQHGPERVEGIRTGLRMASEDLDAEGIELAERSAHSLGSSAATLGGEALRDVSSRIERALAEGRKEAAVELLPELEEELRRVIEELERIGQSEEGG